MKNTYLYDMFIPFFVQQGKYGSESLSKPHTEGQYVYATDSHILLRVPTASLMREYPAVPDFPNTKRIYDGLQDATVNVRISTEHLFEVLSNASLGWHRILEDCGQCSGTGEVTCSQCGFTHECQGCDGTGEGNEIKQFSLLKSKSQYLIEFRRHTFSADYMMIIALLARCAGCDFIECNMTGSRTGAAMFIINEADIVLMPKLLDDWSLTLPLITIPI